jgi:uncharacterized membrane protein
MPLTLTELLLLLVCVAVPLAVLALGAWVLIARPEVEPSGQDDDIADLERRYARGEIDEREFDAGRERLAEQDRDT